MKHRLVVAFAVVLTTACAVVAARSDAASSGMRATIPLLTIGDTASVSSLDGTKVLNARAVNVLGLETVMAFDKNGKLVPWLAQKVTENARGTIYAYDLRKGIKFWDGNELTAADVANSWNYARYPGSQIAEGYGAVRSIVAKNRYTVVVTLKHPDALWQFTPAENTALVWERSFQDAHKTTFGQPGTLAMGTGPYKFDSLDPTSGAELSANTKYWRGRPLFDHISIKFFKDETSEALAFRGGAIDLTGLPVGDGLGFSSTANTTLYRIPSCGIVSIAMNSSRTPWNDIHVRRAVADAVNRSDLIKAKGGYAVPWTTFMTPTMMQTAWSQPQIKTLLASLPNTKYNLAKAKQEMAQSSVPNGFSETWDEPPVSNLAVVAEALAGQLKAIGINITVKPVSFGQWVSELIGPADKRPSNLWGSGCLGPDPAGQDSILLTSQTKVGGFNAANYVNPKVEALLEQGIQLTDPTKRYAIYSKAAKDIATDLPYVVLYLNESPIAIQSKYKFGDLSGAYNFVYNGTWILAIKPK
jgi:ABC-type transport system substrate-binding protein